MNQKGMNSVELIVVILVMFLFLVLANVAMRKGMQSSPHLSNTELTEQLDICRKGGFKKADVWRTNHRITEVRCKFSDLPD